MKYERRAPGSVKLPGVFFELFFYVSRMLQVVKIIMYILTEKVNPKKSSVLMLT